MLPRTQTSLFKTCAQRKAGRRQQARRASPVVCTLPMVPCGSSPVTGFALAYARRKTKRLRRRLCCMGIWFSELATGERRAPHSFFEGKALGTRLATIASDVAKIALPYQSSLTSLDEICQNKCALSVNSSCAPASGVQFCSFGSRVV